MNALDKVISWFDPELALSRERARTALREVRLAYDGATVGRRTDGWFRPSTSANAEVAQGLTATRDGARDLVRNTPHGSNALVQFATKIVGTGIRPQARTGNLSVDRTLDDAFELWAKQTKYYQMQALSVRTTVESGEAVMRYRPRRVEDGYVVPFIPQLFEPDYIDHGKSGAVPGGYIVQGVQFDGLDNEVGVWMFPSHPGDSLNTNIFRPASATSYFVPSSSRTDPLSGVVRQYRMDRAGQVRGITWFAPVMNALWDLAGFEEAERVRKRMESCMAAFVTTPSPDPVNSALGQQSVNPTDPTTKIERFSPGMVARLEPGEEVTFADPKTSGGYTDYTRRQDRLIAVGLGMLYELLSGDLSQVNYSSYRGGLVGLRDWIEMIQYNVIIPGICDPTWTRFVDGCKIMGIVPGNTSYAVEWNPPAFDLLDRLAEAEADQKELRIGTKTWPQVVGRQGYDPQKQFESIVEWNRKFDDAGVILDGDPRTTANNGATQKNAPQEPAAPVQSAAVRSIR